VSKKLEYFIHRFKSELGLYMRISSGIFLFILFFQPFPLDHFNFNNHILFVAGLGGIVFFALVTARAFTLWLARENIQGEKAILPAALKEVIIFLISTVAFVFYLRYVGMVNFNLYITFKVVLICFAPPFILSVLNTISELKETLESQITEKKDIQKKVEKPEEDYRNKSIEFKSENINEKFTVNIAEVAFIRSADNYVEIVYKEGFTFRKKLVRNTMKNIEQQIRPDTSLIRCHRICIINLHFIDRLEKLDHSYWLKIKGYNEKVPVSRQYLLKLTEAL
jgi:DNA-binding LytR/AlgR family response regulator